MNRRSFLRSLAVAACAAAARVYPLAQTKVAPPLEEDVSIVVEIPELDWDTLHVMFTGHPAGRGDGATDQATFTALRHSVNG